MNDAIEITVEVPLFEKAIKEYEAAVTNHDMPYILNRAGRNVATKASHNTPKATTEEITADLSRLSGIPKYGPWLFVLANAKRKRLGLPVVGGKAMSAPATTFLKQRRSSRGYVAAGWTPAIIKFGGHSRAHISAKSKIQHAQNILATADELVAYLQNTAEGAGKVGALALKSAIEETAIDMISYAQKRLSETSKRFSAK